MCAQDVVPAEYRWNTRVTSFDADESSFLRPSSLLKLQQEIGELHLSAGGLSYGEMSRIGAVFVVTRLSAKIHRPPVFGEQIGMTTWSNGVKGVQYNRCYQTCDLAGNVLIDSTGWFVLVDTKEHKPIRPKNAPIAGTLRFSPGRENGCPPPEKVKLPESMELSGERVLRYSDMDYNGHLNNTVYADLLCDFMPGGMKGKRISGFTIQFVGEAYEGDTLSIETFRSGQTVWFSGRHPRGMCFEAVCDVTEKAAG